MQKIIAEKKLTIIDIKKRNLDTLLYFRDFCSSHNLQYFLAFGTLIGAVRHHGFIPWDDDIDVLMPRQDYDRLLMLTSAINDKHWELLSYNRNPDYLFPYMKLCDTETVVLPSRFSTGLLYGLSIDIFPLDYNPGKNVEQGRQICKETKSKLKSLIYQSYASSPRKQGGINELKRFYKNVAFKIGNKQTQLLEDFKQIEDQCRAYEHNKYMFYYYDEYFSLWEESMFFNKSGICTTLMFEGNEFCVPYNYDAVLYESYGNYMELPPVEKQIINHNYIAVLKN